MKGGTAPSIEYGPSRIVIADDHPLFRDALKRMLNGQSGLEVVGEGADGQQALDLCRRLQPDLVLMDMRMPKMDGIEATRAIKREYPQIIVLVLTALENPNHLSEAIKAGAAGYILKHADQQRITDAIRRVLSGEFPLNQDLAMRLLRGLLAEAPEAQEPADPTPSTMAFQERQHHPLLEQLSQKEVEVLRLLAEGRTNQEIAKSLLVSVSTVKKHVHRIIAKLGVSDRTQAAVRAVEIGLLPEQEK